MDNQLSARQIAKLKKAFSNFDVDNNGTISTRKLAPLLESLDKSVSASVLESFIEGKTSIQFHEFLKVISLEKQSACPHKKVNEKFRMYDSKGTGFITAGELRKVLSVDTSIDTEVDSWLRDKYINDTDRIDYKNFFKRKESISKTDDRFNSTQLKNFKEAFSKFDMNNDGTITVGELNTLMKSLGIHLTQTGVKNMMDEFDLNKSGVMDYPEFLAMMSEGIMQGTDFENDVYRECRTYDKKGEGFVTAAELKTALGRFCDVMTVGELDEFFQESNINDDDRINYKQYLTRKFSIQSIPE